MPQHRILIVLTLVMLVATPSALADAPTMRINATDQARATSALLHRVDFGHDWQGGQTRPSQLTAANCPGFDPKESDLIVSGHAEARFAVPQFNVSFNQDVQVLTDAASVRTDFERTIQPELAGCLGYQIRKQAKVSNVTVARLTFPPTGNVSAAFRASFSVKGPRGPVKFISDYVYFGVGRLEYAFNVVAPAGPGADQLVPFEAAMAQASITRAAA
ncbi:MAG: hypothetical protein WCH31_04445 [Actinomycetes bacterium]